MNYVASNGYSVELMNQPTTADGQWSSLRDDLSTEVNTTNTDLGSVGYVDINIVIPALTSVGITSVQIVSVETENDTAEFIQISTPRQIDHLFHYYKDPLIFKPIPSYLVGWDFPLNPAQFGSTLAAQAIGANKSYYAWDQTILFQSANSGITTQRDTSGGLLLGAAVTTQMAVIQYLSASDAKNVFFDISSGRLSVNVFMASTASQVMTVSLWFTTNGSLPVITTGTNNSLVTSLDADGYPASVVAGWTNIPTSLSTKSTFTSQPEFDSYGFTNFTENTAYLTGTYFAIVVGSSSVTAGNFLNFKSISVVPGTIPTVPAPQTQDEVLRECQYYYEMSYAVGGASNPAGTLTTDNCVTEAQAANPGLYSLVGAKPQQYFAFTQQGFGLNFKQVKRASPILIVYSTKTANTPNNLTAHVDYIYAGFLPNTTTPASGNATISADYVFTTSYTATTGTESLYFSPVIAQLNLSIIVTPVTQITDPPPTHYYWGNAYVTYHYTADSRLGVV